MTSRLLVFALVAAFCVLRCPAADVPDFDENVLGFEFIYHDEYDLILLVHRDSCYFYNLNEQAESHLQMGHSHLFSDRLKSEMYLAGLTRSHDHNVVKPSSLDAMRLKYRDLLADFHCLNKRIFELRSPPTQGGGDDDDD